MHNRIPIEQPYRADNVDGGWRDTLLKVLFGIMISNLAWFSVWAQDVVTKNWLEHNPPIFDVIPSIKEEVQQIKINSMRVSEVEKGQIRLTETVSNTNRTTEDLRKAVHQLTEQINQLNVKIATLDRKL